MPGNLTRYKQPPGGRHRRPPGNLFESPPKRDMQTQPDKPQIKEIEVDRAEAIAGIKAEQSAMAQGANPAAAKALMKSNQSEPELHGIKLVGIQGGGATLAAILAIQMIEAHFKPKALVQGAVAGVLCFSEPARVYDLLEDGDSTAFTKWVNEWLRDKNFNNRQFRELEELIKTSLTDTSDPEDQESFQTPGPTETGSAT